MADLTTLKLIEDLGSDIALRLGDFELVERTRSDGTTVTIDLIYSGGRRHGIATVAYQEPFLREGTRELTFNWSAWGKTDDALFAGFTEGLALAAQIGELYRSGSTLALYWRVLAATKQAVQA